jgi:hypothetical protein
MRLCIQRDVFPKFQLQPSRDGASVMHAGLVFDERSRDERKSRCFGALGTSQNDASDTASLDIVMVYRSDGRES